MFIWDAQQIRFLREASEFTPFNDALAARIAPLLPNNAHVCDAGCGLGYLSLALAKRCGRVTAADYAEEALAVLRENIQAQGVSNIDVWQGDIFCMPESMRFDTMVFCFFGGTGEMLRCVKKHCTGKAILFKKNWSTHRFTLRPVALERFTFAATCRELDALGVPYECDSFPLEMGQPFRTMEDAALFFQRHSRQEAAPNIEGEEIEALLTRTGNAEYPYYLPACRPVGMITLDAGHIPDAIYQTNGDVER